MTIGAGHAPLDGSATTNRLAYMVTVNASDAANGTLPIHMHSILRGDLGEGDRAVGITMPTVMPNHLPFEAKGAGGVHRKGNDNFDWRADSATETPPLTTKDSSNGH